MKHLCSIQESFEANALADQLESKGIPIIKTNVGTHNMVKGVKMHIDLWVALESQYQDATALLSNPHHQVLNPVDVADFHRHRDEFNKKPLLPAGFGNRFMNAVVALVLVLFIGWVLLAIVST